MIRHDIPRAGAAALAIGLAIAAAGSAEARTRRHPAPALAADSRLDAIQAELARQAQVIAGQQREIAQLQAERAQFLASVRAAGPGAPSSSTSIASLDQVPSVVGDGPAVRPAAPGPAGPVGERPVEAQARQQQQVLAAAPPSVGVLTPRGRLVLDPSIEYDRTSNDRLVFRGVEIVPGINLGLVDANRAGRDTAVATLAARLGLTDRLEVEARVPYVYRHDEVTTVAAQSNNFQQQSSLYGHDLGDVELAARYQLNGGRDGLPIFVATGRVKPPTGKGPYDVDYDANAIARSLPTGSGFWGLEGGVTMLYPSDPAIIFAALTYLHNFERDVDKTFGEGNAALHVGRVRPGDSIGASLGFGLALNPRFSVSLGYSHNYIFRTRAFENAPGDAPVESRTQALQAGSLLMGWSFRLTDRITLANSFQFGVTSDAPDLQVVFRVPYRF